MDKWVEDEQFVSLMTGGLSSRWARSQRVGDDPKGYGDFMFRSAHGITYCAAVSIDIRRNLPRRYGRGARTRLPSANCVEWSPVHDRKSRLDETGACDPRRVNEQLRVWTKLKTVLGMHFGDSIRLAAHRGTVTEPVPGTFLFQAHDAGTLHIIHPERSHSLELEKRGDRVVIWMYSRMTNTYLMMSDTLEAPEAIFERFTAHTKLIH